MKTFLFSLGFVMLDAIVPKSCSNAQRPYYDEDDSLYCEEDSLAYDEEADRQPLPSDTLTLGE